MSDSPVSPHVPGDPKPGDLIRAKWLMDGAASLAQAATQLEEEARRLRNLGERGWTLAGPVEDDYGHLIDPSGDDGAGRDEELGDSDESAPSLN